MAVHVYYTEEGISTAALTRVLSVLVTSIGVFVVLVYKKIIDMARETRVVKVRQAERPAPYDDEFRKKSDASFIRNPGARASIVSGSQQVDNWVPSTVQVA